MSKRESFCKSNFLDLKSIKIKAVTDRTILKMLKNVLKLSEINFEIFKYINMQQTLESIILGYVFKCFQDYISIYTKI